MDIKKINYWMSIFIMLLICVFVSIQAKASDETEAADVVNIYETFDREWLQEGGPVKARILNTDYRSWSQSDDEWKEIALGNSNTNMEKSGCLVTAISKLMVQCGLADSNEFNPGVLVKWLNKNQGFTSDGSLYWIKPAEYLDGFELKNYKLLSYGTYNTEEYTEKIIGWIKEGYHMVVAVKYAGHWVAIDEAKTLETGEIYIMDSLPDQSGNADIRLIDRYGDTFNRIAAYKGGTTPDNGNVDDNDSNDNKNILRISGSTRYETSYEVADKLKEQLGVEQFDTAILACGTDFADALSGSYLAYVKKAPIILIGEDKIDSSIAYIQENVKSGGTIYVLGGTGAVPETITNKLEGYVVERLSGATRYETNLEVLKEAGVQNEDILVCTGKDFADSLSASAARKPVFLVNQKLSEIQSAYLNTLLTDKYYIIGGENAVGKIIEDELNDLKESGEIVRIAGKTRYETSVLVAENFIENPEAVVLTYSMNYPDGVCGGALAVSMNAPLILTANGKESPAVSYAQEIGIKKGIVLGGSGLISNETVYNILVD